jgi:hypothetical protein
MLHIKYNIMFKMEKRVVVSLFEVQKEKEKKKKKIHYSGFDKFLVQPPDSTFYCLTFLP